MVVNSFEADPDPDQDEACFAIISAGRFRTDMVIDSSIDIEAVID